MASIKNKSNNPSFSCLFVKNIEDVRADRQKRVLFLLEYKSGIFQDKSYSGTYHQRYFFQNKYAEKEKTASFVQY